MYNFGRGRKSGGARATEATPSLAPLSMILFLIKMYFFYSDFDMARACPTIVVASNVRISDGAGSQCPRLGF